MVFNRPPNQVGPQQRRPMDQPRVVEFPDDPNQQSQGYDFRMTALGGGVRAARSAVEDLRSGKPVNATKATIAAVGEENYNMAKGVVNKAKEIGQGGKQMKRKDLPSTDPSSSGSGNGKKSSKRAASGKGRKRGRGGSSGSDSRMYTGSEGGTPTNKLSSFTPYAVTPPGSNVDISTPMDGSLYILPYNDQSVQKSDIEQGIYGEVNFRTALRAISRDSIFTFDNLNPMLQDASYRIFSEAKFNVNANTNGGNAQTRDVMTYTKFWQYIVTAVKGHMLLTELEARMTWSPDYDESNLLIRDMKNMLTSDVDLFTVRNRLRDAMCVMALPRDLMMYYYKLFQPYKKSPVTGGVVEMFMTTDLIYDMKIMTDVGTTDPFSNYKEAMNEVVEDIRTNINDYSVMTAFLMEKSNYDYVSQRYRAGSIDYPCYDANMNGILNNLLWHCQLADGSVFEGYGGTQVTSLFTPNLQIALPMDVDNVPVFLTSHLLLSYTDSNFPFFGNNLGIPFTQTTSIENTSNFVLYTDPTFASNPYGFGIFPVERSSRQITDHIFSIVNDVQPTDVADVHCNIKPKGLNVRRYQPSFESVSTSCVRLMYTLFDVKE